MSWLGSRCIKARYRKRFFHPCPAARSISGRVESLEPRRVLAFDSPFLDIAGMDFDGNPPDTVGDVGPNHYVQMVNSSYFQVYDKSGAILQAATPLDSLGLGACTTGLGDPVVLYDHLADRWLLSELAQPGDKRLCVYVSQTPDPTGAYFSYQFSTPDFPDYAKFSVHPDGYFVSSNESSSAVYALDRTNMLIGAPATFQRFTAPDLTGFGFQALTPADLDGAPPLANSPAYFMRHRDDEVHNVGSSNPTQDFLEIWEFDADFANPFNSTFTGPTNIPISEFDSDLCGLLSAACFPQPGTSTTLDPLREVIMHRLQYRNFGTHETLVGNFVTDVNGNDHGGVRWFELRKSGAGPWSLYQEGTVAPDSDHRWMGAIAMNGLGDMALMYNVSSNTTSPSIRYIGRRASDPLGTMPRGEHILPGGLGSGFNGSNRWGDYSAMSVDPIDDSFWFTGTYTEGDGTSDTRIGAVTFDDHGNNAGTATLVGSFRETPGTIDGAGDVDWFTFFAEAGTEVTLETSLGTLTDTTLALFDSDGTTLLDFNDDINFPTNLASRISFTFLVTGQYYAQVTGFSGLTGTYGLSLTHMDDHGRNAFNATPISGGSITGGTIEVGGNLDWFTFFADSGAIVTLQTTLGTLPDSTLTLYDSDGITVLAFDDDGGGGLASRIDFTFATPGQYFVQVTEFGVPNQPGTYDLTFTYVDDHGNDASTATGTAVRTVNPGTLEVSGDRDWFAFPASAGISYDLKTSLGSLFDSTLSLYDTSGTALLEFNDDYLGLASRIFWTAPVAGTYFLKVEAFSPFDQLGTYDLAISFLGDFNNDGAYNCVDIDGLIATIAASTNDLAYDMNGDFVVDVADRDAWLAAARAFNLGPGGAYLPGDATLDGAVNLVDFDIWNANKFTAVAAWCSGDFTADGLVDGADFGAWNAHKSIPPNTIESLPISEPADSQARTISPAERVHGMTTLFDLPAVLTARSWLSSGRVELRHSDAVTPWIQERVRPQQQLAATELELLQQQTMVLIDSLFAKWNS